MKGKKSGLEKRFRKGLSLLLTLSLLAGMIPDAAFAEDKTNAVAAEAGTEAAVAETETTATEAQPATEAVTTETTVTEASETDAPETAVETGIEAGTEETSGETESETAQETEMLAEAKTESETDAALLGSTAASLCDHGNDAYTCVICEVEALIDELPTIDEISAMDTDGQNEVYTQASDICDIYYDELTEDEQDQVTNIEDLWEVLDYFSGAISLTATQTTGNVSYIDENGTTQTYSGDYYAVDSASTAWGTNSTETWYVVNSSVEISERIIVSGTVNLILVDGCTLTASSGLTVNSGNTLNIYGQTGGTGTVTATGGYGGAGIGGGKSNSSGTITISGGKVTAIGGEYGAGIGGGEEGASGTITINGGTVTATGGEHGAGIGGGDYGSGSNITINGGTVTVTGGYGGAGIGDGDYGSGSNITINGGTVTVTGGEGGAGIGGGYSGTGTITITGGYFLITPGTDAEAIGAGCDGSSATITITGGYFGKGDTGADTVYSVNVASGYDVSDNTENTKAIWPYVVIEKGTTYTVTLEANGGTIADGSDVTTYKYGTGVTLPGSDAISRKGYNFCGWYEESDFSGSAVTEITASDYGNKTFYARWEKQDPVNYIDEKGETQTCEEYTLLTADTTAWTDGNWYVVGSEVEITDRITVSGTVNLILVDECALTCVGITVNSGNTLNIYGQESGTGALTAENCSEYYAGIGGEKNESSGTITINGGMVTATGGYDGAGIGGGGERSGSDITII
ncbi:MAG: InlB B-repeat-containing protein, partial [Lachnospiraceae bacterium]|nr:InlB B-repeat-containing protein [Lachnospiraceae bacterium]